MIQTLFGPPPDPTLYDRFKKAVAKTRDSLVEQIDDIFQGRKVIDEQLLDELEMTLISADVGVRTTSEILESMREKLSRQQLANPAELKLHLAQHMMEILNGSGSAAVLQVAPPEVILMVGVNGTGKTTTIGKLAHHLKSEGKKVLLCAGDTFRAAAAEQLEVWGERTGTEVIKQKAGADPSAVLYRRLAGRQSARGRLRHRRYGRPPAHQNQPDGRTRQRCAGQPESFCRERRIRCCSCSTL